MNTTPSSRPCPQCGAPIPAGASEGLCPRCLLALNLATQSRMEGDTRPPDAGPAVPPLPVEEVAKLFPGLEIIRLVGTGGMGAVYQARQPALDRVVALKLLHTPPASDPGFAERFAQEARALAKLNHPNIVALYESGQAGGRPYFLMEFVDGVNLRQLQQAGRLSPREALQIVPQVCDALQYAHDEGIVHRDIKPENVLLDRKGRVKVADFGLAKLMGRETATTRLTGAGHVMGTPHYMAPEQVEHPLEVDHRADIFSLGVVFYELLTGELPLGKFPLPSKRVRLDVRLDEVVLKALEKEPALRYGQASELKTRVEMIAKGPMSGVRSASGGAVPSNKRGLAYVALGCLVAGIVGTSTMVALSEETVALCLGATTGLMALVFGIESRSERLGRGVAWATAAILVAFGLTMGVWTVVRRSHVAQNMALLKQTVEERARQVNGDAPAAHFGAVVERLVGDVATHQAPELIKLGTGEMVFQKDILGNMEGLDSKKVSDIFRAQGIDATGTLDPNTRGLAGWECVAVPMSESAWADFSPVTLEDILEGSQVGSPVVMVGTGKLPATYAIKTRTGRVGLLQILGFSEKPRGVNIRYKLVLDGRDALQGAESAAQEWLSFMDGGNYAGSWDAAAESFRGAVTKAGWVAESGKIRRPLGAVVSRSGGTTQQVSTFPGMPDGAYWIAEFDTAFAGLKLATEVVTFAREKDGQWRMIGYLIRPRTEEERAVVLAARAWLEGIDAGRYAESWSNASGLFREALSQKKWVEALEEVRRPLGARVFRTADGCTTTTSLPGVPAGKYVVMQFNASFTEDKSAVETVTFLQEKDGVWRAAGYFIK